MSLQTLLNSRLGVGLILFLGRIIPPKVGYPLAEGIARIIAMLKNTQIVKAVRANQWVVSGQRLSGNQLDLSTRMTFHNTADCLYDLYHFLPFPDHIMRMFTLSDKIKNTITGRAKAKQGTIMLAPHLSNFDLAGRVMALSGFKIMVLSYPQPPGGYQWQNKLRRDFGIEILPMSTETLRAAKVKLLEGGAILTGMDRPLQHSNYYPKFFGHPAAVPVSYVRLGLLTNSPVVVVACLSNGKGSYTIDCSDPIEMKQYNDHNREIVQNSQAVLREAERFIAKYPEQWSMFYPVWPWALEKMP